VDFIPMHAWHPLLVHLPLGFLVSGVVVDLVGWLGRRPSLRRAGSFLLAAGVLLAIPAIVTGFVAYGRVDHSDAGHAVMNLHRNLMLAAVALFAAAVVWRWRAGARLLSDPPRGALHASLLVLASATLVVGADRGAQLVFGHATGIPTARLEEILDDRVGDHGHGDGRVVRERSPGMAADSVRPSGATDPHESRPHEHPNSEQPENPR
jgi:uncharacterized membrane protein